MFRPNAGFALITVLFTLATLTVLFAVTTSRVVSERAELRTDQHLLSNSARTADLLRFAAAWKRENSQDVLEFTIPNTQMRIRFQDVGGLVDLNTARPELINALAEPFGISQVGLARFREWRRNGNRLQRVEDFFRLTDGPNVIDHTALRRVATVHSGRVGVAVDIAPSILLDHLNQLDITDFVAAVSGTTFLIEKQEEAIGTVLLGVLSIPREGPPVLLRIN